MLYEVALGLVPKVGNKLSRHLISYLGSAEKIFKANKKKLLSVPGIGEQVANEIIRKNVLTEAEKIIKKAESNNVQLLFFTNSKYPKRLRELADAPTLLYYKGNADLNHPKSIAIVGTRKASDYGRSITEKIIEELKPYNIQIISGLAYGIDITAHKACLNHAVDTIGVMASGIDIIYPSPHKKTAFEMVEAGGLITEYPFETPPDAPRFPERNRIIAGLCDAIIVVETANKGGTLITAEIAYSYNREIYAVPGNLGNKISEGSNRLIADQKAQIFISSEQIIKDLHWNENEYNHSTKIPLFLDEEESLIYELLLKQSEIHIDELSWKSQINISKLSGILLNMEFKNLIKNLPGKKIKLK